MGRNMNRILVIADSTNKERNAGDTETLYKFKKYGLNILDINWIKSFITKREKTTI
jgi:hypothetical protein